MTPWVKEVLAGNFVAVPTDFSLEDTAELATLIDGDQLCGGPSRCDAIRRRVIRKLGSGSDCGANALDLWVTLFNIHRRLADGWPTIQEISALDRINTELRAALLALSARQRAGILGALISAVADQDIEIDNWPMSE